MTDVTTRGLMTSIHGHRFTVPLWRHLIGKNSWAQPARCAPGPESENAPGQSKTSVWSTNVTILQEGCSIFTEMDSINYHFWRKESALFKMTNLHISIFQLPPPSSLRNFQRITKHIQLPCKLGPGVLSWFFGVCVYLLDNVLNGY